MTTEQRTPARRIGDPTRSHAARQHTIERKQARAFKMQGVN